MNEWLRGHLVCPRDKQELRFGGGEMSCASGHAYPVVDDIPIMLVDDAESTHGYIEETLRTAKSNEIAVSPDDHSGNSAENNCFVVDEFVQKEVPYTSGNLYFSLQNRLTRYPIPELRLPPGSGERMLDIGCNWGRWSIGAAQKGYQPIGLDPSLEAVRAARRVSKQLGVDANFVVGDARFLPFASGAFDVVFSYGVFQHLSKENVRMSLDEAARVLKSNGRTLFQMPNKYGLRQYQQHRRRGFSEGEGFEIRYWTPSELMETFENKFGETKMSTDCFFGLGIQGRDADLLPLQYKAVVYASEILRKISRIVKPLTKVADSVYLESVNHQTK